MAAMLLFMAEKEKKKADVSAVRGAEAINGIPPGELSSALQPEIKYEKTNSWSKMAVLTELWRDEGVLCCFQGVRCSVLTELRCDSYGMRCPVLIDRRKCDAQYKKRYGVVVRNAMPSTNGATVLPGFQERIPRFSHDPPFQQPR
eukprot:1031810-Rhodomonas_salina.1